MKFPNVIILVNVDHTSALGALDPNSYSPTSITGLHPTNRAIRNIAFSLRVRVSQPAFPTPYLS